MWLWITPHCVVDTGPRWEYFLTDPPIQRVYRDLWRRLAAALESPGAIYLPDSSYPISAALDVLYEAGDRDDLLAHLLAGYGSPAATLALIASRHGNNHYYCDTFDEDASAG